MRPVRQILLEQKAESSPRPTEVYRQPQVAEGDKLAEYSEREWLPLCEPEAKKERTHILIRASVNPYFTKSPRHVTAPARIVRKPELRVSRVRVMFLVRA